MTDYYRIGVDIGGTFTDFSVIDARGSVLLWKEDSTPEAPEKAIEKGLGAVADQCGVSTEALLARSSLFVHGTTIGTNILIQRSGPVIGLLCTRGFRDILYFRDGHKPERFNIRFPHPHPLVPRYLRIGVDERIGSDGEIVVPLDEAGVREAGRTFAATGVEAVAVAFLWSVANDVHERRAAELLAEELPGIPIVRSAEILPEIREWERTSAAVLSAYVAPAMDTYLRRLESRLRELGFPQRVLIMQVNGGSTTVAEVLRRPVTTLSSGPAAAPAAAIYHGARTGDDQLITIDVGGTSFDVSVVTDGRPTISRTLSVEGQPLGVPGVEVHSVGAGGGSIAWVDEGGALRVGPRSAGARPGPAAYGLGGEEPTVTDANVTLGYLSPTAFLGGRRELRRDLAEAAITSRVATPLGLRLQEAAAGVLRVADSNMAGAIRAVSIERGIDPRKFALVVGGGAGGLHASRLAREVGISKIIIPKEAGAFCAFGMTVTAVRRDHAVARHASTSDLDGVTVGNIFCALEAEALRDLERDGFREDAISFERYVDARYPGQVHELTVQAPAAVSASPGSEIANAFHEEHHRRFTYSRRELPVELLHWRVTAYGHIPGPTSICAAGSSTPISPAGFTRVYAATGEWDELPTYDGARIHHGHEVAGPAIIALATTTILLAEGDRLSGSASDAFIVRLQAP